MQRIKPKSEDVFIRVVELVFVFVECCQVRKVNLIPQDSTYSTESLDELGAFLATVAYKLYAHQVNSRVT